MTAPMPNLPEKPSARDGLNDLLLRVRSDEVFDG